MCDTNNLKINSKWLYPWVVNEKDVGFYKVASSKARTWDGSKKWIKKNSDMDTVQCGVDTFVEHWKEKLTNLYSGNAVVYDK
ncbi:Hypothetical protein ORPV_1079 [Orpheovirus IHUMI-LCC2]|uniref:Uncharacterized protein n=1 Tax=Orpheovirus IHUMI-LCC2 TaxID=2023057 RepID=A0A2I2L615_9VIRU|nr:Hypothetical protein ORPV_1079 [Orpheovirus IHUMI-LCC2]SNW62983.1 Hypothetical protein ORPV_1079 [Orpheovirus IHUMI-LCC2]